MRQIPDPDQPNLGLGKPIRKEVEPVEDEWEPANPNGTIWRNKRTGQLCTSITPKGPQYPPTIYTTDLWDAVIKGMQADLPIGGSE